MTFVQRLVREPNLVLGLIAAGLSLAVLFGVDITKEQMAGIGVFVGALFALVRYLTTPSSEVVAQLKPGETTPQAGAAAPVKDGTPVLVTKVDGTPLR
jgi:hypothetical protein